MKDITMATHTYNTQQQAQVTVTQFVKTYRSAEKRATVSAGGLAFSEQDRLTLNAMRVALGFDFTKAADAVSENPADYARHWQRFQHWANQIKKGLIRVAPEAAEIADRTHKNARTAKGGKKPVQTPQTQPQGLSQPQLKQLGTMAVNSTLKQADALHQLGMIFANREEAEAHLQDVMYGMARLGMDDMDALVPTIQAKLMKAKQDLELEAKAQAIVTVLERTGIHSSEVTQILELAKSLMPA
jgi:hypothetical protein